MTTDQTVKKDFSTRQIQILKAIIDEYIETAEPVGSETLEKKHNLSASPATIRNEMVRLTELGLNEFKSISRIGKKKYAFDINSMDEIRIKILNWNYRKKPLDFS